MSLAPKRPYFLGTDGTTDEITQQVDNPATLQFLNQAAANVRTITGPDSNPYTVADSGVNPRGAKNVVWSSEAFTLLGKAIPALSAAQKKATGSSLTNIGGTVPLDFSPYKSLILVTNLVSFTGGSSPTIQFELDFLDDTGTAVQYTAWKPTALSAAASTLTAIGANVPFVQAAAAAATAPSSAYGVIAIPSGWTYYPIPIPLIPNGQFAWTVANTPTAVAWSCWIYGIN